MACSRSLVSYWQSQCQCMPSLEASVGPQRAACMLATATQTASHSQVVRQSLQCRNVGTRENGKLKNSMTPQHKDMDNQLLHYKLDRSARPVHCHTRAVSRHRTLRHTTHRAIVPKSDVEGVAGTRAHQPTSPFLLVITHTHKRCGHSSRKLTFPRDAHGPGARAVGRVVLVGWTNA